MPRQRDARDSPGSAGPASTIAWPEALLRDLMLVLPARDARIAAVVVAGPAVCRDLGETRRPRPWRASAPAGGGRMFARPTAATPSPAGKRREGHRPLAGPTPVPALHARTGPARPGPPPPPGGTYARRAASHSGGGLLVAVGRADHPFARVGRGSDQLPRSAYLWHQLTHAASHEITEAVRDGDGLIGQGKA
jgi:hypothetical protein